MSNKVIAASGKWARELMSAGCPIDYPEGYRPSVRPRAKMHLAPSNWLDMRRAAWPCSGPSQVGYAICVRLVTPSCPSGTVFTDWSFDGKPWPGHFACFDYEPQDVIPHADHRDYRDLFDSPLMKVLGGGRRLRRGCPIEGLLCGLSYQPVPESCEGSVFGKLTLLDDKGSRFVLDVEMAVVATPQGPC